MITLAVGTCLLIAAPAPAAIAAIPDSLQQAVDDSVAAAATDGVQQSVAVVDRTTGEPVAGSGGDEQYISESIVKLFTVAYYLVKAGGQPETALADRLRTMIVHSDDEIESSLWNTDIVPAMAARYGLAHTSNGPKTGPHDWGWELITADDEAQFLFEMSNDPQVAPLLMAAMANVAPVGSDGFDQSFGMNALPGDHGSKQGWTDVGSTGRLQIHSVGWTDRYFVAILQTSAGSDVDTMRADSTRAARAVLDAETPGPAAAGPTSAPTAPATTGADPAATDTAAPSDTAASTAAPGAADSGPAAPDSADAPFTALLRALWRGVSDAVADLVDVVRRW